MFLVLFTVSLVIYPWLLKVYQPATLGVANVIMARMDPPTSIVIGKNGGWQALDTSGGYTRGISRWRSWQKHLHYLSLALLPALILATPAPWPTRFKLLAIAMPLLFIVHSVTIVGVVRAQYCYLVDRNNFWCIWLLRAVNTSGQLFGAGLWALLTWRYWFGRATGSDERQVAR
jgi:hypothetical protein